MAAPDAAAELRAVVEFLRPDLADELRRLQALEHVHAEALVQLAAARRDRDHAQTSSGHWHERALKAEHRLVELGVEEISKARRAAFMLGDGFLQITCRGRGRYDTTHIPTDRVTLR